MKRWVLKAGTTDLDGLILEDVPMPEPGSNQVRIRIHAVSLNYRDQLVLKGPFGRLPDHDLVLVSDGAGEIDAVGAGVNHWRVGDRVAGLLLPWTQGPLKAGLGMGLGSLNENGMLSEYVVLPSDRIVPAPANLNYAEVATLPCAALTAWNALYGDRPIGSSSKVLVLGSGGVSLFALLFARAVAAQVIATSSQDTKMQRLIALGASDVINYQSTRNWGEAVFERTGGVDKVVDTGGTGTLNQSIAAVGYDGEIAFLGLRSFGDPLESGSLMGKGATIRGIAVGSGEMYAALAQEIETHHIQPPIDRKFHFKDAKDAFRFQSSPDLFGKIVIEMT